MAGIKKRSRNKRVLILPDAVRAVRVIIQGRWVCCLGPIVFGIEASHYLSIDPTGTTAWVSGWKGRAMKKQVSKQAVEKGLV